MSDSIETYEAELHHAGDDPALLKMCARGAIAHAKMIEEEKERALVADRDLYMRRSEQLQKDLDAARTEFISAQYALAREAVVASENLTSVQRRCTELLNELRSASNFNLGKEGDDDQRDFVLVTKQYPQKGPRPPEMHLWGVFVFSHKFGICLLGTGRRDQPYANLAEKSRQFDSQKEALDYGWALLKELRHEHG
jgi:hypothetical protein